MRHSCEETRDWLKTARKEGRMWVASLRHAVTARSPRAELEAWRHLSWFQKADSQALAVRSPAHRILARPCHRIVHARAVGGPPARLIHGCYTAPRKCDAGDTMPTRPLVRVSAMSYTVTLGCGCRVYVACHPRTGVAHTRIIETRSLECRVRSHDVGVRIALWELLPYEPDEPCAARRETTRPFRRALEHAAR
jgi:hypothetical protein